MILRRERTALVTGGNRGIGLAACRALAESGLKVVLTSRRRADAETAAAALSKSGFEVRADELDLASEDSVRSCAARLARARVDVDVLINNGAVLHEGDVLSTASERFRNAFDVNVLGALWCCRAFVPGMLERDWGRVVNVSSGWGAFAEGLSGPASYSITKAALNALTLSLSLGLRGDVKVNSCCPGWVRTRMGGKGADRSPEDAAGDIVWLATLPKNGPSGGFFRERRRIEW